MRTCKPKTLAVRTHRCNVCDLILDWDHNSGINILKKGLEIFVANHYLSWRPLEVTPAEIVMQSRKLVRTSHDNRRRIKSHSVFS
ncbi:MAG: hypothetical protein ABI337_07770 [Nitrososphaera sp.]